MPIQKPKVRAGGRDPSKYSLLKLFFIVLFLLILNFDLLLGASLLAQALGWFSYNSLNNFDFEIKNQLAYNFLFTFTVVVMISTLVLVPIVFNWLTSKKRLLIFILVTVLTPVGLAGLLYLNNLFNPLLPQKEFSGPELWAAVNNRRTEKGVPILVQNNWLCTIAAIRLQDQIIKRSLDGHEGFTRAFKIASDSSKGPNFTTGVHEFLVQARNVDEAISMWQNTLAHRELLENKSYKMGCVYAQGGFGVAEVGD